jgi:hypothetical protein
MRTLIGIAAAASIVAVPAALAHHGWSTYDPAKVMTLEGAILETGFEFPHGEIVLESGGKRWMVVLAPPSRMRTRGLAAEDLAVGKAAKVEGYPLKNGEPEMRAERITVAGKTVELR